LAEDRVTGAMVGQTFRTILVDQFTRLRDGDQYWWENRPWAPEDRALLDQTTLSGLILRNTNTVRMQPDAFVAVERTDLYNGASLLASPIIVPDPPLPSFNITFDGSTTTFDKKFTFTIKARDSVNFSELLKSFSLTVVADNAKTFANLFVKAFQSKEKRLEWYNFITDSNTFVPTELYRYGDTNFSVQTEIKMLVYAGIESTTAVKYVQAMSRNHYRKRLKFGGLKSAQAKDPITQKTIYEVVYVEIIDDLEKDISSNNNPGSTVSISNTVQLSNTINSPVLVSYDAIRIDSDIPLASDRDHQRVFPNSIKNMRKRIQGVGNRDREFLPLWMRSIQDKDSRETGFVKALVLCYVNPASGSISYSENIINRIKAKIRDENFDFRVFDFEIDRYLIDIINGEIQDKYLAFPQRKEKLP
jgi:hypothetical protein